jgi:Holliday junction resolvase-like predicted endonuclease
VPGYYFELVPLRGPVPGALQEGRPAETAAPALAVAGPDEVALGDQPFEQESEVNTVAPGGSGGWGGGESDHHKTLKEYVATNASRFGVPPGATVIQEFSLRSGDCIDVVFQTEKAWIAVEVKSKVSELVAGDYERGIVQVIKYRAVLQAQAAWVNPAAPRKVRVLLALQGRLPPHLRGMAQEFNCEFVEGVEPPNLSTAA